MLVLVLAGALGSLLALAGCGGAPPPGADARREIRGEFKLGDATLTFTATFQDTALIAVSEDQSYGELGRAHAEYEVVDGRLSYYRCEEQRQVVNGDRSQDYESVRLELEFDAWGDVQRQRKTVDGSPAELLGYEAPGVQRHFAELKRRAGRAGGTAIGGT